jgi:hypothetical protein
MYAFEHILDTMLLAVLGNAISVKMRGLAVKNKMAWKRSGHPNVSART